MAYDWIAYYKTAYEQQKRANTVLASQVSDAEAKRESLQDNLTRIENNVCYRMFGPLQKVKNLGHHMKTRKITTKFCDEKDPIYQSFQKQLAAQNDPYGRWIQEIEPKLIVTAQEQPLEIQIICFDKCGGIKSLSDFEHTGCESMNHLPEILLFVQKESNLDSKTRSFLQKYFSSYGETALVYAHEDQIDKTGRRGNPWFKPAWSPDTLLGFFYFGSMFAVRREAAKTIEWEGAADGFENLYDFVLKLTENIQADQIQAIDAVLYHQKVDVITQPEDYISLASYQGYQEQYTALKQRALERRGFKSRCYQTWQPDTWTTVVTGRIEKQSFNKDGADPQVSVVIPTRDHPQVLQKCLQSFLEKTCYNNLEFVIVDNGSLPENKTLIEQEIHRLREKYDQGSRGDDVLEQRKNVCFLYIYEPMEFNFSAMCNKGAKASHGDYILLLNNDIEIIEENWLQIMLGQAMLPHTGAVGAKLWYPEGQRIQHTGITNMHIGPSHKLVTYADDKTYYYGHNTVPYNMIGVTAACLLVRRSIYEQLGGLDENMKVSYNDVDFCFKIAESGYFNVIRNDAVLLHHESLTRGLDEMSEEKWERLLQEKAGLYEKHPALKGYDPYYSEHLADNDPAYKIGYHYPFERLLLTLKPEKIQGKKQLHTKLHGAVMLTMERVMKQHKIHLEEPDIYMAEGWCYILGADNSRYERFLILENESENWYYKIPVLNRYRADVEAILPMQTNIELSGFVCRILKQDLTNGIYKAGILYQEVKTDKQYFQTCEKQLEIQ